MNPFEVELTRCYQTTLLELTKQAAVKAIQGLVEAQLKVDKYTKMISDLEKELQK